MATLINGADFLDEITITDENDALVDITNLPGFRVVYYTKSEGTVVKFSKDGESGYLPFIIVDAYHYKAYIETLDFEDGVLKSDVYIAVTNTDLAKGKFVNLGTKVFDINIITRPITQLI